MNLKPIKANMTELTAVRKGAIVKVLFSYQTPVAYTKEYSDGGFIARRTSTYYSRTTSKHINQWLGTLNHCECPQSEIDGLVK